MSEAGQDRLVRSLGLGQITASGVGIIIGAGIYVLLGAATAEAGAAVWVSFLLAGLLSALTALSYAELAAMYPNAGAEYEYTRRVAPPSVAFVIGWLMVLGLVVAAAAVALGFGGYVAYLTGIGPRPAAFGLLAAVTLIAWRGVQQSTRLTVALSVIQVGGLVAIVTIGVPHLGDESLTAGASVTGIGSAAALVFFAFIGFDEVITLAEETNDPVRTVPKALLLSLGLSTALYVLVAVAAISVLGPHRLAASSQPLADVAAEAIGSSSGKVVAVVALIATMNTTLLAITAASRMQYGMAGTGALPAVFGRLNRRGAPWVGLAAVAIVAGFAIALGDVAVVAGVTDFAVFVVFIAVNVTVILLRFWQPKRRRPFKIGGTVARVPVTAVLALGTVGLFLPSLDPTALAIGGAMTGVGLLVHAALVVARSRQQPRSTLQPERDMTPRTTITCEEAAQVADTLRIDFDVAGFDLDQFRQGMCIELQHGTADPDTNITNDDLVTTGKIALAHLNEIPDYYTRLAAMEADARREVEGR